MSIIFIKLVNMSIIASWLIIMVILLRAALCKAPKRIICFLWGIVAARLILPFSPESTFSFISNPEPLNPDIIQLSQASTENIETLITAPIKSVFSIGNFVRISSIIWLIGVVALLSYALISHWRIKRQMREAVFLRENIWICDNVSSPFILGIIKPRIYLSSGIAEKEAAYVIAHERAHLERKDYIWKPFGFLLLSIYWFNPLIWAAYSLFCKDIELACDEKVIKNFKISDRKNYSEALLFCSLQRKSIIAYPLAFGETGVKERIKNVLNYKKPAFWICAAAVIVCIIIAVCFLTVSKKDTSKDAAKRQETQRQYENHDNPDSDTGNGLPEIEELAPIDAAADGFGEIEELAPIIEDNWPTELSRTTQETTAKNLSFDVQIDKPMVIIISCVTESGQIDMEIKDKSGNKYFSENNMQTDTYELSLDKAGTYSVIIQAKKHTGSFKIAPKQ